MDTISTSLIGKKRNRPALFLRKFLHKISVRYRNKLNKFNIIEHNLNLIDKFQIRVEEIQTLPGKMNLYQVIIH